MSVLAGGSIDLPGAVSSWLEVRNSLATSSQCDLSTTILSRTCPCPGQHRPVTGAWPDQGFFLSSSLLTFREMLPPSSFLVSDGEGEARYFPRILRGSFDGNFLSALAVVCAWKNGQQSCLVLRDTAEPSLVDRHLFVSFSS